MEQNWKKNVALFIMSQSISLGSSLVQYAIMWYITLETQSGVMMTIYIICGFLPTFFLSPFAGVWADRYNRKRLIIISDSIIASVTLILAILFLMGYKNDLAALCNLSDTSTWVGSANAGGRSLPPADRAGREINESQWNEQQHPIVYSTGFPVASGALLTMATIEMIFFIDVVTAAAAVLTLKFFLKIPAHLKALNKQKVGYFTDLYEGFRYIKDHEYVRKFVFCGLFFLLVSPVCLTSFRLPEALAMTSGV